MEKPLLTLVVPAYNEQETLALFYAEAERVRLAMPEVEFEYVFVDDGSRDGTLAILRGLHAADPRVHYISLSRNFGKEAAIVAGLQSARGDYLAIMDADLQDPPALLPEMWKAVAEEGYDCVGTCRKSREGEPPIRSYFARKFYKLINRLSTTEIVDGARDFHLMSRKVADAVLSVGEYNRFSKGIFGWVGFRKKWLAFPYAARAAGETKWSFWKLFAYAMEGITAFSTLPLMLSSLIGLLFCLIALLLIVFVVIRTAFFGDPTSGWPSMICIFMMVSGVQLFCLGILGQYLAKTYLEAKRRPIYIAKESA